MQIFTVALLVIRMAADFATAGDPCPVDLGSPMYYGLQCYARIYWRLLHGIPLWYAYCKRRIVAFWLRTQTVGFAFWQ
jgi:hypothetical protein